MLLLAKKRIVKQTNTIIMSKEVKIGIIVTVIAMIAIVAYFVYKKKKTATSETTKTALEKIPQKGGSTASDILNLSGDVLKDVANSDLIA